MHKNFQKRNLFVGKGKERPWYRYLIWVAFCIGVFYSMLFLWPVVPSASNDGDVNPASYKAKITPQSGISAISRQLSEQGISSNRFIVQMAARALFVSTKLKPGTYLFPLRASLGSILLQMARGDRVRESITIIPGMTIWQVRNLVDKHPSLIHQTKGLSSKELLQMLNLTYPNDEGLFFPDTYIFDPDDADIAIYRRASQAMQKQLSQAWGSRPQGTPLKTPYELLTLASIIEKETGRASERPLVAAVFINRLNLQMPLQTDPTVIYGIGPQFDGNLRKADLRKDSPYNTYMRKGLPPTPIAMPSKESLFAAVNPAQTNAIYFVARGDGSSHFSRTLKEHESAVDQYQRKRKPSNQPSSQ